jgi:DNA-binding NtrC family response regulator
MAETKKPAILIVDDETEILFSLPGLLRKEFEVYTAATGYQALQMLGWHPIQVVLADQRMPGMTGIDLLGRVRQEYPDVVRLIFTGYADIRAVIDAINKGHVYHYINKPWDPDELRLLLHQACAHYEWGRERQRLLKDLRSHLGRCLATGKGLREAQGDKGPPCEQAEEEQLAQAGNSLLDRLVRVLTPA